MILRTTLIVIVFFLGITGVNGQESDQKQHSYVNKFIQAVLNHDSKKVIKLLDKEYSKEQLAFLGNNEVQFVDELFGGRDMLTEEYINTKFHDILKFEVAEVVPLKDGSYKYMFRIRDGKHDILKSLFLVKNGKKYGFVGTMG